MSRVTGRSSSGRQLGTTGRAISDRRSADHTGASGLNTYGVPAEMCVATVQHRSRSEAVPLFRVPFAPFLTRAGPRDHMTEFLRFYPSESDGPPELKTLWITNMWPDEVRPYFGNYIKSQCESLWRLGLDVDVVYLRGLLSQKAYFTQLPAIRKLARDPKYKVIHAHYGHTGAVAVATGRTPLIISFCGEDLLGAPRDRGNTKKSDIEAAFFRHLPRRCAATITKSAEMELKIPKSLRFRNNVLPNGVDTEVFQPRPMAEARQTLGWDQDVKTAMFLGNPDDPRKRVELAQAAMEQVVREVPDARLEIASGYDPSLVPTLMNAADTLVFPSRSEGSP